MWDPVSCSDPVSILRGHRSKNLRKYPWHLLKNALWIKKRNFIFEINVGEMNGILGLTLEHDPAQIMIVVLRS